MDKKIDQEGEGRILVISEERYSSRSIVEKLLELKIKLNQRKITNLINKVRKR